LRIDKYDVAVLFLALVTVGLGMIGTVLPAFTKPPDRFYTALQGFVDDYVGYVSYVKEGMYGANYFRIRSIPPPQPFSTVHLIYVYAGKIGGLIGLDAPYTYHVFRALLGLVLVYFIYLLMRQLFNRKSDAVWATVLSVFATSAGWYSVLNGKFIYNTIAGFWFVNNDALRFTNRPHYLLGAIIFIAVTVWNLNGKLNVRKSTVFLTFIFSLILGTVHPSFALMLGSVSALMLIRRVIISRDIRKIYCSYTSTGVGLAAGMGLSYLFIHQYPTVWVLSFEEYVLNETLSPDRIIADIIAFGPCLWIGAFTLLAGLFTGKKRDEKHVYMLVWLVIQLLFFFGLYKLFRSERVRYIQSLYFIPMGYGTMLFLDYLGRITRVWVKTIAIIGLLIAMLPTIINGTVSGISANTNYRFYPYFIFPTQNMMEAYRWLDRNSPQESTVIAAYEAANNIIMYSHNYVIGNKQGWPAAEGERMEQEKEQFFGGVWDENTTREYLTSRNIRFVYRGYQEEDKFLKYPFYAEVYRNPEVVIYRVKI
jgi:hypothetical protein